MKHRVGRYRRCVNIASVIVKREVGRETKRREWSTYLPSSLVDLISLRCITPLESDCWVSCHRCKLLSSHRLTIRHC